MTKEASTGTFNIKWRILSDARGSLAMVLQDELVIISNGADQVCSTRNPTAISAYEAAAKKARAADFDQTAVRVMAGMKDIRDAVRTQERVFRNELPIEALKAATRKLTSPEPAAEHIFPVFGIPTLTDFCPTPLKIPASGGKARE